MKVNFTQTYFNSNIDVSIDEFHKMTIPYSKNKSLIGYIRQVPDLVNIELIDEVSFSFQGGETEKEEMIITFIQVSENPIKINQLSLYGNSNNQKALGKFKLFMDGSDICKTVNYFILGKISDFILSNGKQIKIAGSESIDSLYLGGNFEKLTVIIPIIEKIRFFTQNKNTIIQQLNILSTKISKIEISGTEDLEINEFLIENSEILGGIFSNIIFRKAYFLKSIIENTNFYNVSFPVKKEQFIFSKTTFIKTSFTSVKWGNYFGLKTKIHEPFTDKKRIINIDGTEMKETYRMFKYLHDEIGNKTEANKFFAKEMFYHRKNLWKDGDYGAWLISFLQIISNNYGAFWWLPLLWIIGISFSYTLFVNCPNFSCACGGIQNGNCFSSYWLKNVSQFPTELKNASSWGFFWYSIIMGGLIYQFIIALRRISQR